MRHITKTYVIAVFPPNFLRFDTHFQVEELAQRHQDELKAAHHLAHVKVRSNCRFCPSIIISNSAIATSFIYFQTLIIMMCTSKDLGKVAALRELSIEKDRFLSQLKYNKDVHNIMSFALNTCEQTLNEVQPHVVTKLIEGRNKRLKVLESNHKQQVL